jgi:RNA recognition motif-containing protein
MSGKKIFIGNLSYKTKEADLIDAFKKCGKVIDAKVVRKMNGLSKGFGFVEYEKEEDALKAVEELDKFEIFERPINVQLSTSTGEKSSNMEGDDDAQRRSPKFNSRPFRNDNRRPPRSNNNFRSYNNNYSNNSRKSYTLTRRDGYDRRDNYGRRDHFERRDNGRRYNQNNRFGNRRPRTNNGYNRVPEKKSNENENNNIQKTESKTTVFVANLPFSFIDENLVELFKECGGIKTAHVVRTERRSRGYGFVEFENKEGQENALKKMNDFPVKNSNGEDRNLIVKIAVNVEDE